MKKIKKAISCNADLAGKFMILCGLLCAVPLLTGLFFPLQPGELEAFGIPAGVSILAGLGVCWKARVQDPDVPRPLQIQKSGSFVLFAWLYGILIGALPFVLAGRLNFIQALFESVSGWTTTGLSVLDVSEVSPMFLFHRGFMQYCGGLGFVMVMTLFVVNRQSMNLVLAEGHSDQLAPNLSRTVRLICLMYTTFLVLGTAAYTLAGMNVFDSLIHAMCALSTGGFSTRAQSIGYYQSPLIEFITVVLMLIGTTNFAALLLLIRGQIRKFLAVSEIRFLGLILAAAIPLTALVLFCAAYTGLPGSFRIAFFEVISALSTSGFSTVGYADRRRCSS